VQPATEYAPKEISGGRGCGWYAFFASYLTHPPHYNAPIRKKRKDDETGYIVGGRHGFDHVDS
jgi:hypothetical protein